MMHKVKDVVSKFFNPSFLFTASTDTNQSKRKRSTSEEDEDHEQITTTTTTDVQSTTPKVKRIHQSTQNDDIELTDDETDYNQDTASTEAEQQKKRRRTANYQQTDAISTLSNITPVIRTSTEENYHDRINRLTASKQRFNIPSTYRESLSNYDPSKSPLFTDRKTSQTTTAATTTAATNLKSNEFSANFLLATSLVNRSQQSMPKNQQSPATLTNPNRILSNERQMLGVNYSSINSRRLPYIERLRRRTLQDCIRLNRTLDNEPLSESTIEEHKSTSITPVSRQTKTKTAEKECGVQCDLSLIDSSNELSNRSQSKFPPIDIQYEALSAPMTKQSQSSTIITSSSITIEQVQSSVSTSDHTKPKVLGDITPFSWPKFARAQEEYARKHPEKCTETIPPKAVGASTGEKSNGNINLSLFQQPYSGIRIPAVPSLSSSSTASTWKCDLCTKENSAQAASCSLCRNINKNYKKMSAPKSTTIIRNEPVTSKELSSVVSKESSIPQSVIITTSSITTASTFSTTSSLFNSPPTTSKDISVTNTVSFAPPQFGTGSSVSPATKESSISSTSMFDTTSSTKEGTKVTFSPFATATSKENSVAATNPQFGNTTSFVPPVTKESPAVTATLIAVTSSSAAVVTKENSVASTTPLFGVTTTSAPTVTKENPTSLPTFQFGTTPSVAPTATKENPTAFSTFQFGTTASVAPTVTKENPAAFSTFQFGTTASVAPTVTMENPLAFSTSQFGTTKEASMFGTVPATKENLTQSSTLSLFVTATTKENSSTVSTVPSFGTTFQPFSSVPTPITSSAALSSSTITPMSSSPPSTPVTLGSFGTISQTAASLVSSRQPTSMVTPVPTTSNLFSNLSSSTFPSTNTAPPLFQFGTSTSGFNFPSSSTATQNNPQLSFGTSSTPSLFTPPNTNLSFNTTSTSQFTSSTSSNPPVQFGFGATSNINTSTTQSSMISAPSSGGFAFTPQQPTIPTFGAGPSALSSGVPPSLFNFVGGPAASTNSALFQFPPPSSSVSPAIGSNVFDAGTDNSQKRPTLKPRRRMPRP